MGISAYCGEDSPVLGGEVAEGFGIELHGEGLWRRLLGEIGVQRNEYVDVVQ